MNSKYTRKEFLTNASKAAVGITGVAALSSLATTASAKASTHATWPWPYKALDPDEVRIQAHNLYWNDKDCCSGVFGAIVNALVVAVGDPWTNLPMEIMLYGRGGGAGWGSLCGTLNGASALISLVTEKAPSGNLISELWGWYSQAELPTTVANEFATGNRYLMHKYDGVLIQNIAASPLCHVSVGEWCVLAQKKVGDVERKERCARLAGDIAARTVELLNAHFAGTFTPTYTDPASVTGCMTCHGAAVFGNVLSRMDCEPCHGADPHSNTNVQNISEHATSFKLEQNYPNPFNPSTKIQFSVPVTEKVKLEIYDLRGALVKTLVDYELHNSGTYQVEWNGRDNKGNNVSSGIYFSRMQAGTFSQTKKMTLVK